MITNTKKFGSFIQISPSYLFRDEEDQPSTIQSARTQPADQTNEELNLKHQSLSNSGSAIPLSSYSVRTEAYDYVSSCCIPSSWIPLELLSRTTINYNTCVLTFRLPHEKQRLDLPIGTFLLIKVPNAEADGNDAIRPYTSISDDNLIENQGIFQILCKRYDEWGQKENPKTHFLFTRTDHSYRPPGVVSIFLHKLPIGQSALFKRKIP